MIHTLKILADDFLLVREEKMKFLIRKDNNFCIGDYILLQEFENGRTTGWECMVKVSYVLRDAIEYGLVPGYAILSINLLK